MSNYDKTFLVRMTQTMQDFIAVKAGDEGISQSQWIRDAINEKASREPRDFEKRESAERVTRALARRGVKA